MLERCLAVMTGAREATPLVHCLTNSITSYVCAGIILAAGGNPIMAEHPRETEEITAQADALLLNLGNISDTRLLSMRLSALVAKERGIPVVLDAVGVGCSTLRLEACNELLELCRPAIIKGNRTEIMALYQGRVNSRGVDAQERELEMPESELAQKARLLAGKHDTVVMASGPVDIVASREEAIFCTNGAPVMGRVCGTGCMLGALTGVYASRGEPISAALTAALVMGVAGEIAAGEGKSPGAFPARLLDAVHGLGEEELSRRAKFYLMET